MIDRAVDRVELACLVRQMWTSEILLWIALNSARPDTAPALRHLFLFVLAALVVLEALAPENSGAYCENREAGQLFHVPPPAEWPGTELTKLIPDLELGGCRYETVPTPGTKNER